MDKKCVHIIQRPHVSENLCAITVPLIKAYAERVGADVNVIGGTRAFPDYPPTYERMQIFAAGRPYNWNICVDTDMLLGPTLPDATTRVPRHAFGIIMNYSASLSFSVDNRFFGRDGRDIVPVEAFLITSDWTHDLWEPLKGSAVTNMAAVFNEYQIAEYALAFNMAKYGLKCVGVFPAGSQIDRVRIEPNDEQSGIDYAQAKLREWDSQ